MGGRVACAVMRLELAEQIAELPPDAQKSVADYVGFLSAQCVSRVEGRKTTRKKPLRREPFVGMWKDRADMADSTAWVRGLRRSEWS